jgi:hypothetical protein
MEEKNILESQNFSPTQKEIDNQFNIVNTDIRVMNTKIENIETRVSINEKEILKIVDNVKSNRVQKLLDNFSILSSNYNKIKNKKLKNYD